MTERFRRPADRLALREPLLTRRMVNAAEYFFFRPVELPSAPDLVNRRPHSTYPTTDNVPPTSGHAEGPDRPSGLPALTSLTAAHPDAP